MNLLERKRRKVAELMMDLEAALRVAGLWQSKLPSAEALASVQPFCFDTLELHQWLQFIFIPTIQGMLEHDLDLPESCAIAPMAEEVYKNTPHEEGLVVAELRRIDHLLSH